MSKRIVPEPDTLQMIEDTLRKEQYFESEIRLWKALPKSVQYGKLDVALSYLEWSNKITQNRDGSIAWIFVEVEKAKRSLEESTEL